MYIIPVKSKSESGLNSGSVFSDASLGAISAKRQNIRNYKKYIIGRKRSEELLNGKLCPIPE
jgi:hypothetical protein